MYFFPRKRQPNPAAWLFHFLVERDFKRIYAQVFSSSLKDPVLHLNLLEHGNRATMTMIITKIAKRFFVVTKVTRNVFMVVQKMEFLVT